MVSIEVGFAEELVLFYLILIGGNYMQIIICFFVLVVVNCKKIYNDMYYIGLR